MKRRNVEYSCTFTLSKNGETYLNVVIVAKVMSPKSTLHVFVPVF